MKRRDMLRSMALIAGFGAADVLKARQIPILTQDHATRRRVLRIAHLTDIHISNDVAAINGLERCLAYLQDMSDRPDIIFNGGDTIEDGLYKSKSAVRAQWKTWHDILQYNSSLEMRYCLGNHDIWGLYNPGRDAMYGKQFALDLMRMEKVYHSFDLNGWHFVFLDSTQKKKNGLWYTAKLDEEQFAWLKNDLASTDPSMPVMIISHIPILCANIFMDDMKIRHGKFTLPGSWMHTDVQDIVALFSNYENVKLCLSGHIHMADAVTYNKVTYYCNGAVSGDWWKNPSYKGTPAGFGIIDLFDDGTHQHQYHAY